MATKKKLLQAAAGNAGGAGLNVEDVFSTYLYSGNSSTQTITNGIDLSGEGGLVWLKSRDASSDYELDDTVRGVGKRIASNQTYAEQSNSDVSAFNSNGFDLRYQSGLGNASGETYASWTFRKAPKFFDVVTYSGTGSAGLTVNHNLGSVPGCIWVKRLDAGDGFQVYHRGSNASAPEDYKASLNDTAAFSNDTMWNDFAPTATQFQLGARDAANRAGTNYVAYLFAHNDGDGEFGPDGDADIIKCGSYTGTGSTNGPEINLGFEPQWVMVKRADAGSEHWAIIDNMREMISLESGNARMLKPNNTEAEESVGFANPLATGFKVNRNEGVTNASGGTYIYIAIRRGTAVPESATDVFAIDTASGTSPTPPTFTSGFPVDMYLYKRADLSQNWRLFDRMRGDEVYLKPNNTEADDVTGDDSGQHNDLMTGIGTATFTNSNLYQWMWKRAPNYMDVVAYQGTGTAGFTFNHNLGVVPEMIWVKNRGASEYWAVYHKDLNGGTNPSHYYLKLNDTNAETDYNEIWNDTEPTATQVTVGQQGVVNSPSFSHIAYLFATLAGISKVGSYTGTGATLNIDCGFSSGARFVLLKRTDSAEEWRVFDTARGIVTGNDPLLNLNSAGAEEAFDDLIDPYSAGFSLTSNGMVNVSGGTYIFYAIA